MEFLKDTTVQIIEICNRVYPKLGCGYFSDEEEEQLEQNLEVLKDLSQKNLDLMYPERLKKTQDDWLTNYNNADEQEIYGVNPLDFEK